MKSFIDNFSKQAEIYARFRPSYPQELFQYLHSLTQNHMLAWDCGTGNGQSAIKLTEFYEHVYASDPSEQQIHNATPNDRITYKVETAEETSLPDSSVDLVTVAQAIHWFNFDKFYAEVKRVLNENGIIAVWTYGLPHISEKVDSIIRHYHDRVVGEFWQEENKLIDKEYSTIPFPFKEIPSPVFKIQKQLTLTDLLGLCRSWSATQKFIDRNKFNPIEKLREELLPFWQNEHQAKESTWKLVLRAGKVSG